MRNPFSLGSPRARHAVGWVASLSLPAAVAALLAGLSGVASAGDSLHSAPLPAIPGTDQSVTYIVTNANAKGIEQISIRVRSVDFLTVVADDTCHNVPLGAACKVSFAVSGAPFLAHFACSVEATGDKNALRGIFHSTDVGSSVGGISVEIR